MPQPNQRPVEHMLPWVGLEPLLASSASLPLACDAARLAGPLTGCY